MIYAMLRFSMPLILLALLPLGCASNGSSNSFADSGAFDTPAMQLVDAQVSYHAGLDSVIFELEVSGDAASLIPTPAGAVDGAPVLGYVFPTTLAPSEVGFSGASGTVALAVTSHPDFDDTPLWDEDNNAAYDDDGAVYHSHWVLLQADERAPAGLAVVQSDDPAQLPPTAPMAMYLDSPGFTVIESGSILRVLVPADRLQRQLDFRVGALSVYMEVALNAGEAPLLAVHQVISTLNEGEPVMAIADLERAPASAWPLADPNQQSLDVIATEALYYEAFDTLRFSMDTATAAATIIPEPVGSVDGAPVLGYVFATNIAPASVGFQGIDGTLVLAVTSHPDFDDTPLWDEGLDGDYGNDGAIYHVHWAVLVDDALSPAGLSVPSQADSSQLPPTAPMPIYLDSPGYHAFAQGNALHVLVPGWHLDDPSEIAFDALTAWMRVDASGAGPVLRVEEVIDLLSGDLSLPFRVRNVSQ